MNQADQEFSTQKINPKLLSWIIEVLKNKAYGSVEIYIQNYRVTQITERTITKVVSSKSSQKVAGASYSSSDSAKPERQEVSLG